jgi:hypothetical protein
VKMVVHKRKCYGNVEPVEVCILSGAHFEVVDCCKTDNETHGALERNISKSGHGHVQVMILEAHN